MVKLDQENKHKNKTKLMLGKGLLTSLVKRSLRDSFFTLVTARTWAAPPQLR